MPKIVIPVTSWGPLVSLLLAWIFTRKGKNRIAKFWMVFFLGNFIIFGITLLTFGDDISGFGSLLTLLSFIFFVFSFLVWQNKN